jgi:hypothetical protein
MNKRRVLYFATTVVIIILAGIPAVTDWRTAAEQLPARLTDQEFWKLVSESSEPGGTFHSENLVSNEIRFQSIVPELVRTAVPGRAYIGVGSEQNFTYIAAIHPVIAFIVDLRRGNLDLHLIYKVLFELSADRVEFVSRLFSREKPAGLTAASSAADIFAAYRKAAPSKTLYDQNLKTIKTTLTAKHGFQLSTGDLEGIDFVYSSWFRYGPDIRYELTGGGGGGNFPTYAALMTTTDAEGKNRSYLATEETFRIIKDLEARNMIVPVVGNFGGPKALRAVGAYLNLKSTVVSAFYTSNVEQYLRQDGIWGNFCKSTAMMPIDSRSVFLRSARAGFAGQTVIGAGDNFVFQLSPIRSDLNTCLVTTK